MLNIQDPTEARKIIRNNQYDKQTAGAASQYVQGNVCILPIKYSKDFFTLNGEKIMFYIIKRQYSFNPPQRWYVDIINQGYKDCNMDREYLKKRLTDYNIDL